MTDKICVAATNNPGKLIEIREIIAEYGWKCLSLKEAGIVSDPEETGDSFLENATIKALAAAAQTDLPVLADDSGLCVDALGGAPGVHTARYAGEDADFNRNMDKLLSVMKDVPDDRRAARFCCCMVAAHNGNIVSAYGECAGFIGRERLGTGGFGYNPVFYLGEGVTMATISEQEKIKYHTAAAPSGRSAASLESRMINSKQRAFLRGEANTLTPIFQLGKDGISELQLAGIDEALTARELIKLSVLESSPVTAREAAGRICGALGAEPVQVIGRKLVVYRRNPDIDKYGV